jgi:hypothetical protein
MQELRSVYEKIKNKFKYEDKYYIPKEICWGILVQESSGRCEEILEEINLRLQFKMTDTYKLQLEREIWETEQETRRLENELEVLREQIRMERSRNK